jgi:hypothetical protein
VPVPVARPDAHQHRARGHRVEKRDRCVAAPVMRWILPSCTSK